ncbi:unnamed protein product [Natator depressus]
MEQEPPRRRRAGGALGPLEAGGEQQQQRCHPRGPLPSPGAAGVALPGCSYSGAGGRRRRCPGTLLCGGRRLSCHSNAADAERPGRGLQAPGSAARLTVRA